MAKVVLGVGTSHSTQVSLTPDWWAAQGEVDQGRTAFDELVSGMPEWMPSELTPEVWQRKYEEIQAAIATLTDEIAAVDPDVMLIIGDDQHELFLDDTIPTFSIWGSDDLVIPAALHAFQAERAHVVKAVEIKGGSHALMVSHPAEVTALIEEAATSIE